MDGSFSPNQTMRKLAQCMEITARSHPHNNVTVTVSSAEVLVIESIAAPVFPTSWLSETHSILATGNPEELSGDHSEFNDATDYLQENTEEGLVWVWTDGDLILKHVSPEVYSVTAGF